MGGSPLHGDRYFAGPPDMLAFEAAIIAEVSNRVRCLGESDDERQDCPPKFASGHKLLGRDFLSRFPVQATLAGRPVLHCRCW